ISTTGLLPSRCPTAGTARYTLERFSSAARSGSRRHDNPHPVPPRAPRPDPDADPSGTAGVPLPCRRTHRTADRNGTGHRTEYRRGARPQLEAKTAMPEHEPTAAAGGAVGVRL